LDLPDRDRLKKRGGFISSGRILKEKTPFTSSTHFQFVKKPRRRREEKFSC